MAAYGGYSATVLMMTVQQYYHDKYGSLGDMERPNNLNHPNRVAGIVYSATYYDDKALSDLGITLETFAGISESPSKCIDFYVVIGLPYDIAVEPPHARRNNATMLIEHEMSNKYTEIKVPTLVVQGKRDEITSPEATAKQLRTHYPITPSLWYWRM
jgi:pimeloyl-ACP methyl ester carboxylesterase